MLGQIVDFQHKKVVRFNCELFTRPVRAVHLAAAAETRPENSANIFGVLRVLCVCGIERSKKQQQWWCRAKRTQQRRKIHFYSTRFADGSEFLRSSLTHCIVPDSNHPPLPPGQQDLHPSKLCLGHGCGLCEFCKTHPLPLWTDGPTTARERERRKNTQQ